MTDTQDLRNRVLCEAEIALQADGFFGVSLRQVATNCGVHPRTIASLFGNRRNLLRTVEARLSETPAKRASASIVRLRED